MYIDFNGMSPDKIYMTMIQTVIPRPIAWVLSENENGGFNLAPFSYFNAVCSNPPLVMISVGRHPDGRPKDTRINIEARHDFVVHIVDESMLDAMNVSSATLPYGESEVTLAGLNTVSFEGSRLPRLEGAMIAFACTRYQIQEVGEARQSLILGEVAGIHVDEKVVGEDSKGRSKILADSIRPVGRLGPSEYTTFGELVTLRRPA